MQAIRKIKRIDGNKITIELPQHFSGKEVEIIIIQIENGGKEISKSHTDLLLSGPVLTHNELKELDNVGKWFDTWYVE